MSSYTVNTNVNSISYHHIWIIVFMMFISYKKIILRKLSENKYKILRDWAVTHFSFLTVISYFDSVVF